MLLFFSLVTVGYLLAGHFFLKGLAWLNQSNDLVYMKYDAWPLKALLYILALIVWPSFILDLGESLVKRRHR